MLHAEHETGKYQISFGCGKEALGGWQILKSQASRKFGKAVGIQKQILSCKGIKHKGIEQVPGLIAI